MNVPTSFLARLSDVSIHMNCGPEIGVAATKSFTSQLTILYAIVDNLSYKKAHRIAGREVNRNCKAQ